jgi:ABC-type antimicrobial peptide transport system permease subunit
VKIQAGTVPTTLPQIEKVFRRFNPGLPFDYKFLDSSYQALYASEQRIGTLAKYFASIAIVISCLGLFGLAAFTAERRVKEIGIRKILGATNTGIVRLLSAEFSGMVLMAVVIGLPVSYMAAMGWLSTFAYRTDAPLWLFASAGMVTLGIAWLTVAAQTLKAARTNPAQTLKTE